MQSELLEAAEEPAEKDVNGPIAAFWVSSSCTAILWTIAGGLALVRDVRVGIAFAFAAAAMTFVTGRTARRYVSATSEISEV